MLKRLLRVLGLSTKAEPPAEPEFKTVIYETRPDPTLYMTERERRYHSGNHAGR